MAIIFIFATTKIGTKILKNLGKEVGNISVCVDPFEKYMRPAGFGEKLVRNDDFISDGLCPEAFS